MPATSAPATAQYNIVRRAYGVREIAEKFVGTWVDATVHAMRVEASKRDGEYSAVPCEHGLRWPADGFDQSSLPIAWL